MENWQETVVVEIANLQRTRKKITVEYLAWFMENILGSWLCGITVWKTRTHAGSKVSYACRSWLRGICGLRCVIYSSTLFNYLLFIQGEREIRGEGEI